jgi:hypothetical protein
MITGHLETENNETKENTFRAAELKLSSVSFANRPQGSRKSYVTEELFDSTGFLNITEYKRIDIFICYIFVDFSPVFVRFSKLCYWCKKGRKRLSLSRHW